MVTCTLYTFKDLICGLHLSKRTPNVEWSFHKTTELLEHRLPRVDAYRSWNQNSIRLPKGAFGEEERVEMRSLYLCYEIKYYQKKKQNNNNIFKTWRTVTIIVIIIGICVCGAGYVFRSGTTVCVRPDRPRGQWNCVTLPSHPLADAVVAKMLWQCVFKVSSDFLRNINKIVWCVRRPSAILYYKNDMHCDGFNYQNTTSRVPFCPSCPSL